MHDELPSFDPDARRADIRSAAARTVLDEAARRLAQARADYEDALDRRAPMPELQVMDREVARAERLHAEAQAPRSDS